MATETTYRNTPLAGWGQFRKGIAQVAQPETEAHLQRILQDRKTGSLLPVGKQRSYGDSCLNTHHAALTLDYLDHAVSFDEKNGEFVAEAGITLQEINSIILPLGWFLPVTPGTEYPSLGGCLAADVHGKNHHQAGALGRHVLWMDLLLADGTIKSCSPKRNKELFSATLGGMGLTGIILRAAIQLQKVTSGFIVSSTIRAKNLTELMDALTVHDGDWPYTVSWVDCTARGEKLGRGLVMLGRHADIDELPRLHRMRALDFPLRKTLEVPCTLSVSAVNPFASKVFNLSYLLYNGFEQRRTELLPFNTYFYPLDILRQWYRLYGHPGFLQYQFLVPMDAGKGAFKRVLHTMVERGHPSALAVLKRFGRGEGLLSFPREGWNIAMDVPVRPGLLSLLDELDRIVLDYGGRIYLAKDARMKPEVFHAMYRDTLPQWQKIKRKADPDNLFQSDQSRRLRIMEELP